MDEIHRDGPVDAEPVPTSPYQLPADAARTLGTAELIRALALSWALTAAYEQGGTRPSTRSLLKQAADFERYLVQGR